MKKLILTSLCLVSLASFSQSKRESTLTYEQGKGTGIFNIPAEMDLVEGQEFVIKDKKRSNIGLTFYKTTTDTLDYYVDISSPGEKGIVEQVNEVFGNKGVSISESFKCTESNQPYFVLNRSGKHVITLKRGDKVRTYKLNLELDK